MNDAEIRRRLHAALGEPSYPPDLPARAASRLRVPVEPTRAGWVLAVVAAVLAIAVVATILLGVNAFHKQARIPVAPQNHRVPGAAACLGYTQLYQPASSITMANPSTGWADGGLRTTDGGATWKDMSPTALRSGLPQPAASNSLYPPGFKFFALDASHAWEFRTFTSATNCADHGQAFATKDGGRTWHQSQAIPFGLPAGWGGVTMALQFVDPSHGWVWIVAGPWGRIPGWGDGVLGQEGLLYSTRDGGLTWRLVSTLTSGQFGLSTSNNCTLGLGNPEFVSSEKGWMEVACGSRSAQLLVTQDGGASWQPYTLPVSSFAALCPCSTQLVHVFDAAHLIVQVNAGNTAVPEMTTSDGGRTWQMLPRGPGGGVEFQVDYEDALDWWAVTSEPTWQKGLPTNDWLYRTTDGGATWTLVQTGLPLGYPVDRLVFIDAEHGLAAQAHNASTGAAIGPDEDILVTNDGGHTWRVVGQLGG